MSRQMVPMWADSIGILFMALPGGALFVGLVTLFPALAPRLLMLEHSVPFWPLPPLSWRTVLTALIYVGPVGAGLVFAGSVWSAGSWAT